METLSFYGSTVNERHIARAVEVLEAGGIIVYPTDTLYALGCDALNNRAVQRLCTLKGLDLGKDMPSIVCSGLSMASEYAQIDNHAFKVMKANTPGAFTFVLPAGLHLPRSLKGRKSTGIRIPDSEIARALADALGRPLLTTSIDIDDPLEAMNPESIAMHYEGRVDLLLDGGYGSTTPSTVVDLTDSASPSILRQGDAELI